VTGSSVGVRAGYRLWTPVAVELLLEGGTHEVDKACDTSVTTAKCGTRQRVRALVPRWDSLRFGRTCGS